MECDQDKTGTFRNLSVVLPVLNEVDSLRTTFNILVDVCWQDVKEVLLIVGERTSGPSVDVCEDLRAKYPSQVRILKQTLPFLGGALRTGFAEAQGSHCAVLFADLESDPHEMKTLISQARIEPNAIISASRWLKGGGFRGYPRRKLLFNYLFQKAFALFYLTSLTDFTFGYRLYPTRVLRMFHWRETRHCFVFESILKPLRRGIRIIEIPTWWTARAEGIGQATFATYLPYMRVGVRLRFRRPKSAHIAACGEPELVSR
jgi:glycosyltransferase involved in cell wall biosynthesis